MDLVISGMDCSYQWVPSLNRYQESLVGKYTPTPSNVDHPGEVVLKALRMALLRSGADLGLIYDPALIDLKDYYSRIEEGTRGLEIFSRAQRTMIDDLLLADDLIGKAACSDVIVLQLSDFGSSVLVVSQPGKSAGGIASIKSVPALEKHTGAIDYLLLSESTRLHADQYQSILSDVSKLREDNRPIYIGRTKETNKIPPELAELLQIIQSVHLGLIPASRIDPGDLPPALDPGFSVADSHHPWLSRGKDHIRRGGLYTSNGTNHQPILYVVEEISSAVPAAKIRVTKNHDPLIFIIPGDNLDEIRSGLQDLEGEVGKRRSLIDLSAESHRQYKGKDHPYHLCLLADDPENLRTEIKHASSGLDKAFQSKTAWSSPKGSYFTSTPLGSEKLAFIYPGAFNAYPGMARDLFYNFPFLQQAAREKLPDLSHSLAEEFIYPSANPGKEPSPGATPDEHFYQNPQRVVESGISYSFLLTLIMQQVFNLEPDLALGYSLGEASMLWANQVWNNGSENSRRWKESSLFLNQLTGSKEVVRKKWQNQGLDNDFWGSFILKAKPDQVEQACSRESLAVMTIINTADEVVIAGEKNACLRVIDALGCRSLPMPFDATIHHPAMVSAFEDLEDLFSNPTDPRPEIDFYSASHYEKLVLEKEQLAYEIANMTCQPLDFPRLINKVYEDGARLFIEIGPQKTCSRWIKKILQDKPHAVIPVNKRHQSDFDGFLQAFALLISHGVKPDLSILFDLYQAEAVQPGDTRSTPGAEISPRPEPDRNHSPGISQAGKQEYLNQIAQSSSLLVKSHRDYLAVNSKLTHNLGRLLDLRSGSDRSVNHGENRRAIYTRDQIISFTTGDPRHCFGDLFSGFGARRIPRLPNGELQFLDRVTSIHTSSNGKLDDWLQGEYDLPVKSWYREERDSSLPYVSLMEIALQPCGFLSAAHGTLKGLEDQDLYFRNLDGEATLHSWPEKQSGSIESEVKLLSSHSLNNVIIQKYSFELSWGGGAFYSGSSTFGYFPKALLEDQSGLNNPDQRKTWFEKNPSAGAWRQFNHLPAQDHKLAQLPAPKRIWISRTGGIYSSGYLYLDQEVPEDAWFYKAHFYQDPVMPGSLGVENMARALITAAGDFGLPDSRDWRIKDQETLTWKYRGQITQTCASYQISIHIKDINQHGTRWSIVADGELWNGDKQLYQVDNISLELW